MRSKIGKLPRDLTLFVCCAGASGWTLSLADTSLVAQRSLTDRGYGRATARRSCRLSRLVRGIAPALSRTAYKRSVREHCHDAD